MEIKNIEKNIGIKEFSTSEIVKELEKKEVPEENEKYTKTDIKKSIKQLNKFLEKDKTHAEYSVHEELNRIMIKIIDDKTDEIILEAPPKKIIDMVAKMCELAGVIVDKRA